MKRKQKERERKEAMAIPIDPLPEHELRDYEKLRENNIEERKNAMMKCDFFNVYEDGNRISRIQK